MRKRALVVGSVMLALIVVFGAWFLWAKLPRSALPALPSSATPQQVVARFASDFARNRPADADALIARDITNPQPSLDIYRVDWLHNDPGDWARFRIVSQDSSGDHDGMYAPYGEIVTVEVDMGRRYQAGESDDFEAGDPVVLYFTLGRMNASSPWRIVDIEDNDV